MIPPYRSTSAQLAMMRLSTVSTASTASNRSTVSTVSATSSTASPTSPKTVHFGPVEHIETQNQEPVSAWDDDSDDEEPSFIFRHLRHKPSFRLDRFARRHTNSHASISSKDDSYIMRTSGDEIRVVPQPETRPPPSPDHRKLQQEIEQQYQNEHFLKAFSLIPPTPAPVRRYVAPRQRSPLRKTRPSFFRSNRDHDDYDTWG